MSRLERTIHFLFPILIFLFVSCQSDDTAVESPKANTRPPAAELPTSEITASNTPQNEAAAQSGSTLKPETAQTPSPAARDTEPSASSTDLAPEENSGVICGQLLSVTPPAGEPVNLQLPEINLVEQNIPPDVLPALRYLRESPESVGLVAFEIGRETEGLYINPDRPMPLASVVKIINLVAYAQALEDGQLDPASWIEMSQLDRYYLPRIDLGAHQRALDSLEERGLISGEPPSIPLEEVPGMMIRYSSNAAADFIHSAVGQRAVEQTILDLGMASHTAPCPWIGQFLILANHERVGSHKNAVQGYIADPDRYAEDVMAFTSEFSTDETFRSNEIAWRRRQPTYDVWREFGDNLNAHASAADYAHLFSLILQNQLSSPYVNLIVRRALEWPSDLPENQGLFSTIGYKGGSLPGILTTAYYGQHAVDGRRVVVILFFNDLPRNTYDRWRDDLSHDYLARWLLEEPDAIDYIRQILGMS